MTAKEVLFTLLRRAASVIERPDIMTRRERQKLINQLDRMAKLLNPDDDVVEVRDIPQAEVDAIVLATRGEVAAAITPSGVIRSKEDE